MIQKKFLESRFVCNRPVPVAQRLASFSDMKGLKMGDEGIGAAVAQIAWVELGGDQGNILSLHDGFAVASQLCSGKDPPKFNRAVRRRKDMFPPRHFGNGLDGSVSLEGHRVARVSVVGQPACLQSRHGAATLTAADIPAPVGREHRRVELIAH
jgi:hypothetical protein